MLRSSYWGSFKSFSRTGFGIEIHFPTILWTDRSTRTHTKTMLRAVVLATARMRGAAYRPRAGCPPAPLPAASARTTRIYPVWLVIESAVPHRTAAEKSLRHSLNWRPSFNDYWGFIVQRPISVTYLSILFALLVTFRNKLRTSYVKYSSLSKYQGLKFLSKPVTNFIGPIL